MREDNNGFVNFPNISNRNISKLDTGKTLVYIVVFDPIRDINGLSYINLNMPGNFVSDDVNQRPIMKNNSSFEDLISTQQENDIYDKFYFPNFNDDDEFKRIVSTPLISSICIGWSDYTYEIDNSIGWYVTFRDLTTEGRRLYYGIKKLHNTKEVRILTFNNI